jgi:hypothetical protein
MWLCLLNVIPSNFTRRYHIGRTQRGFEGHFEVRPEATPAKSGHEGGQI